MKDIILRISDTKPLFSTNRVEKRELQEYMEKREKKLQRSFEMWDRARRVIPGGTQTLSKGPNMFTQGVYPIFLDHGEGSHVWDIDGNEYIDYPLALGPVTLGYNHPSTVQAITTQIAQGSVFSLMHPLEVEVAELLCEVVPCAEMVRFGKNGADATTAAVKIARVVTGREHIAHCGYHGFHDWYIAGTEHNAGVPQTLKDYIHSFQYNDISSLEALFASFPGKIAAVIMEPVSVHLPDPGFLESVQNLTHQHGALLVFDEIVTGFRLALGGAQEYYGIVPDLAALGKGMANGLPISAVVGKKDFMQQATQVFFSTTYGGECLALAAVKATIQEMREKNVNDHIWKMGRCLQDGTRKLVQQYGLDDNIKIFGLAPKFWIEFVDRNGDEFSSLKGLFFQEAVQRGVLIGGLQYFSYSHRQEDIDDTLLAFEDACQICRHALDEGDVDKFLEGTPPGDVFQRNRR
jgi:glutamate-1-semialdehyde aminotransferase